MIALIRVLPLVVYSVLIGCVAPAVPDLVSPQMTDDAPTAGLRVRQTATEYAGTEVYHSLYLPTDWQPGRSYPVIVEYTGNYAPRFNSTGEVRDANLGYGLTGGTGYIWIVMPYVAQDGRHNERTWWGDRQATIDYCKTNLPRICEAFGGDGDNVLLCGFSRGAIACSYIGLADDEIAALWRGMITHDHFDGQRQWGYAQDDRAVALERLSRLNGRPVLVCGIGAEFLHDHTDLADFTFMPVPVEHIYNIPEAGVVDPHTDRWMHRDSVWRQQARAWLAATLAGEER